MMKIEVIVRVGYTMSSNENHKTSIAETIGILAFLFLNILVNVILI